MSDFNSSYPLSPKSNRSRRRLAAWLAFGVLGIGIGAVWATGFATVTSTAGANAVSPIVAPSTPADHTANLASDVTTGTGLVFGWAGRWGTITSNANLFTVDLTAEPAGHTYNIAFLLSNAAALSSAGWTSLQLKVEQVDVGATGPCDAATFDGNQAPKVMAFDSADAGVYWNGLAGGDIYCIGMVAGSGQDTLGTFLRRASDTVAPTVLPSFITTVDRAS
jgi:hypothetical protein